MKVQVYVADPADALLCADLGVDFVGLVSDDRELVPSSLSFADARMAFDAIGDRCFKVALSVETNLEAIKRMVGAVRPDHLHLGGELFSPETVAALRSQIAPVKVVQAIPVDGPQAIALALSYQRSVDLLMLDSNDPTAIDIGATGRAHDWAISAQITKQVSIPVVLAGGLGPHNVAQAIERVRPWGVDSFSSTNDRERNGRKDLKRVEEFVLAARNALRAPEPTAIPTR